MIQDHHQTMIQYLSQAQISDLLGNQQQHKFTLAEECVMLPKKSNSLNEKVAADHWAPFEKYCDFHRIQGKN